MNIEESPQSSLRRAVSLLTPGPWFVVAEEGMDFIAISTTPGIAGQTDHDAEVLGSSEWLRATREDLLVMAASRELLDLVLRLGVYLPAALQPEVDAVIAKALGLQANTGISCGGTPSA